MGLPPWRWKPPDKAPWSWRSPSLWRPLPGRPSPGDLVNGSNLYNSYNFQGKSGGMSNQLLEWNNSIWIWRFPKMEGITPVIIHFRLGFSIINHPFGVPPFVGTPEYWNWEIGFVFQQMTIVESWNFTLGSPRRVWICLNHFHPISRYYWCQKKMPSTEVGDVTKNTGGPNPAIKARTIKANVTSAP